MGKEERKQKIEELSKKMKEVNIKIKEGTDTVIVAGMEAKDVLDEKMKDAQSGLEAAKEQCRIATEKGKSKISSELLKAQMNFKVAKENMQERKEARDKEKLSKYIDDELEYADQSIALAFLAVEEAKVAFLNAVEAQQEYDEKYGDDE